jgi:hypothetical protein
VPRVVPPGNPALATIKGYVFDTGGGRVNGAGVTVLVPGGANIVTTTDCSGAFTATNVPLNATGFKVASPDPVAYYNYANYNGKFYDLVNCTLPLPALSAGMNAPFTDVVMYLGGPNPPPQPPAGGCPP